MGQEIRKQEKDTESHEHPGGRNMDNEERSDGTHGREDGREWGEEV